ncbi:hypothetical protein BDK51DRAFT_37720 [Blyttiomyces helicus]|uniref:Uncharacterized protein n=1 Tax=Blyttiomyces helicus TaxID=388810 RepID=A0A4P9WHB9_9FUNG|nr:hypothetical protein BDK51DRAFT_37720 [Blyttiomyces helicus]|eukprot:RKO92124.1 hypothetical protein BDK51DRAFT_37720 [Blyttiomyces helicus]
MRADLVASPKDTSPPEVGSYSEPVRCTARGCSASLDTGSNSGVRQASSCTSALARRGRQRQVPLPPLSYFLPEPDWCGTGAVYQKVRHKMLSPFESDNHCSVLVCCRHVASSPPFPPPSIATRVIKKNNRIAREPTINWTASKQQGPIKGHLTAGGGRHSESKELVVNKEEWYNKEAGGFVVVDIALDKGNVSAVDDEDCREDILQMAEVCVAGLLGVEVGYIFKGEEHSHGDGFDMALDKPQFCRVKKLERDPSTDPGVDVGSPIKEALVEDRRLLF